MEFQDYRSVLLNTQVLVDAKRKEKMKISIDVSFPEMPCFLISLDVMDVSGDHQNDVESSITKTRLSLIGDDLGPFAPEDHVKKIERPEGYCGSCYGAEKSELLQGRQNVCCQTCGEVRSLLALTGTDSPPIDQIQQCVEEGWAKNIMNHSREGCRLKGNLLVNKVPGNVHFAAGIGFEKEEGHFHDMTPFIGMEYNFSHTINFWSFGERLDNGSSPLDGFSKDTKNKSHNFRYFIKVVSTTMNYRDGNVINTNQYSVTQHDEDLNERSQSLPGVFFHFEISPLIVVYNELAKPLSGFLTSICAILGGIYTIAKILDSLLYQAEIRLARKNQMGKAH